MQKLVWINGNNEEINLTSGDYGITNWEGFSNTDLNIQSQQVPMQDGSVFLDALLSERQLSVTLAINDKNDLEKRYQLKRELIHRLNPKLGEGYLIYTNDFISKRIKCIPKLPLFPTKNSNNPGTQKASLSWTACDPYWEDVEETSVDFGIDTQPVITNEGDVPVQVKIDLFATNVTNPKITNLKSNKSIEYKGILTDDLEINTENGNKYVRKASFIPTIYQTSEINKIFYFEEKEIFLILNMNEILYSYDGESFYLGNFEVKPTLFKDVCYSKKLDLFVAINDDKTFVSSDGINWTSSVTQNLINANAICYSENLELFIIVCRASTNNPIYKSTDGINWEIAATFPPYIIDGHTVYPQITFTTICYSESLESFVASSNMGIYTSVDGTNWVNHSLSLSCRKLIEVEGVFVGVNASGVYTSTDAINWTKQIEDTVDLYSICYSNALGLFVAVGYKVVTSKNGINWTIHDVENFRTQSVCYSEKLGLFFATFTNLYKSINGEDWNLQKPSTPHIYKIVYSKKIKLFISIGQQGFYKSQDCLNWENVNTLPNGYYLNDICYSEKIGLFVAVASSNISGEINPIFTSQDGITWTKILLPNIQGGGLNSISYSEKLGLFVIGSNCIFTSQDGITWRTHYTGVGSSHYFANCYSKYLNKWVLINYDQSVAISNNGENWNNISNAVTGQILNLIYVEVLKIFVAVGKNGKVIKSIDGINWEEININTNNDLRSIIYVDEYGLFFVIGTYSDLYVIDSELKNYKHINIGNNLILNTIFYDYINKKTIIDGTFNIYLNYSLYENQIQNISADSDMTFNLEVGDNQLRLNKKSGSFRAKLSYRQKYLGV